MGDIPLPNGYGMEYNSQGMSKRIKQAVEDAINLWEFY
jgi:hypothetical protein